MRNLIYGLLLAPLTLINAADNSIKDGDFENFGKPDSSWQVVVEKDGIAELAKDTSVKGKAVHLKSAQIKQDVNLPDGLMELTVIAHGQGELTLRLENIGERSQSLSKTGGTYGYLFEAKAGTAKIVIGVSVDGIVSVAAILPATDAQKKAWVQEQESIRQFGFVTASAQRPSPGSDDLRFDGNVKPLEAMSNRVVLEDSRLNVAHVQNIPRVIDWLAANGFKKVDAEQIGKWMQERIAKGDAYGSVAVLANGSITPAVFYEGEAKSPLWRQYIQAGGRIVQAGDVPLYYPEFPIPQPLPVEWGLGAEARGISLLGLSGGWSSPYWGKGETVVLNPAAKGWGLESVGASVTGFPIESVSLAFDLYTVQLTGKKGTANWFKNVRPDMPWSGLIHIHKSFDANNDAQIRDIWRTANYVGKTVEVPALPPPYSEKPPRIKLDTIAGEIRGRHEFVRGESVVFEVTPELALAATAVKMELLADGQSLTVDEKPIAKAGDAASFMLDTSSYAYRAYDLKLTALKGGNAVETKTEKIGIRYIRPETFNWQVWNGPGSNPKRTELEFDDIRKSGLEVYLTGYEVAGLDATTRQGLGFSFRAHPEFRKGKEVTFEKNPDYFRLNPEGKPMPTAYSGGRPGMGISHADLRADATESMREQVKKVAGHPAFRPYVLCNDDWSIYYGWDYAAPVISDFKAKTGMDAPRKMEKPKTYGVIPANDPWLKWFDYTLRYVDGAMNKAEADGVAQARSGARTGPIPGGMQIPLVMMWEPAQYPTYSFGPNGFNLICSYYYNTYWQPVMTVTFWMQIGRMGNRELPQWNMPDCFMTAGYSRNNLFHYLAGGVQGLAYYCYPQRSANAWPEFHRLGPIVRRIGPVQMSLKPASRGIGMLNSFTSNCFDPGHTLVQVYGFHNLMQGHFDVEMVSEDEIVAGRASQYKAILLYNINYLSQSVYDALVAHAAKGGLVILDTSIPFEIPGAKRIAADIGMGKEKTLPFPPEGAHLSTPGIRDYGHEERILLIQKAVAQHVKPWFDCTDIKIAATRMEAGGLPYAWFMNVHDAKEYMFCRERMGAGHPGSGTPDKVKELIEWENAEFAKGPFTSTITMEEMSGIPYDLVSMKQIPFTKKDNGFELKLSMERFGGALVVWLPEEIASLELDAPRSAKPNEVVKVSASLYGKGGGWFGFGEGKKIPGALAVEFILKDPDGKEHVVSGVRATKDGTATFDWTPAKNDPSGKWILTAKDLTSGKKAECRISLNP